MHPKNTIERYIQEINKVKNELMQKASPKMKGNFLCQSA